jgi:hypothetical protein
MSDLKRSQTQELLRLSAAGDERSRQELTGVVMRRLSSERGRLAPNPGPAPAEPLESTCLDLVAAAKELSLDILGEPMAHELQAELLCGVARAIEELLGTTGAQGSPMAPAILLYPLQPGAGRVRVSTPELGDALSRMKQLQGKDTLLAILCLVLDQSVDEAARAIQRPADLAELEWTVAREWLDRELDLSARATGA